MCPDPVQGTEEDVVNALEAGVCDKVECLAIVLPPQTSMSLKTQIWERIRKDEKEFDSEARKQFIPGLAMKGGKIDPIYRHYPDARVEKEAFALKPGEVSALIDLPDETTLILRCVKHLPRDDKARIEEQRPHLEKRIFDRKL